MKRFVLVARIVALFLVGLSPPAGRLLLGQGGAGGMQPSKRNLASLLDAKDPAWPMVLERVRSAKNQVEVLPANREAGRRGLVEMQVTTHSTLGAVIYESGGILVDRGWLRILGSGSPKLTRSLSDWNYQKTYSQQGERPKYLLVADDAVGGFFAVNGGALGNDEGNVYYLAPDTLEWQSLKRGYTDFLEWCFTGDLAKFYEGRRWQGWGAEVSAAGADKSFSFYPPLWTKGPEIGRRSHRAVPVAEAWGVALDTRAQLQRR